ncbi:ankyrin repeat-containing domain protein, partial [Baffinella frigidus]
EARCAQGWSALTYAAARGNDGAVLSLLNHGASVTGTTINGSTALHLAACGEQGNTTSNYCKVIQLLLGAGADINALCHAGWSPLHESCYADKGCETFLLLRSGADVRLRTWDKNTAAHFVCSDNYDSHGDTNLAIMCALGADPSAINNEGEVPLHLA